MTRGVDEGDGPFLAVDLGLDLVGADGLRNSPGLPRDHVGVTQRVEELRLAVVDVTHDSDDRRAGPQVRLIPDVLPELQVKGLEQLAILILRRDHLDVVVQLGAQHLEGVVGHRLGGGDHLTKVEQHLYQSSGLDPDFLREIGQRCAASQPHSLAITLSEPHATDGGGLHLVEFLPALFLGLASAPTASTATAEGSLCAAATTTTTATTCATGRTTHWRATEPTAARTSLRTRAATP